MPYDWEPPGKRPEPPTLWTFEEEVLEQVIAQFEDRKLGNGVGVSEVEEEEVEEGVEEEEEGEEVIYVRG